MPDRRFGYLHLDLVGPLPESHGQIYIFTIADWFSLWVEAIPLVDITAESCVRALLHGWIFRYGVPNDIVADRGAQFTSTLWRQLHDVFGIKCSNTTAYHPQANGMIERFHRQLKASLMAVAGNGNWMSSLPLVLLGLRTSCLLYTSPSPRD